MDGEEGSAAAYYRCVPAYVRHNAKGNIMRVTREDRYLSLDPSIGIPLLILQGRLGLAAMVKGATRG